MGRSIRCPVCEQAVGDVGALAGHLVGLAEDSEAGHVMWLNRNVTKQRVAATVLEPLLAAALAGRGSAEARVMR